MTNEKNVIHFKLAISMFATILSVGFMFRNESLVNPPIMILFSIAATINGYLTMLWIKEYIGIKHIVGQRKTE